MMIPKPKHKRRIPTQRHRNTFPKKVREQVLKETRGLCQQCNGRGTQVHHVVPRGRGGRGVYTNAMLVCNSCHHKMHQDNKLLDYWIDIYKGRFGPDFYKDEWD